jgi:ABC-2 type transport system ATP-binding protein
MPGTSTTETDTARGTQAPGTRAPDTAAALSLRGITKRFGATTAVDGIDLDVPRGSFYGLVGPNGAGKTTTLSMATGLLRPDAGTAHVLGTDVWADPVAAKRQIGVLPDGLRLFDRLTGAQLVTYAGLLRGLDAALVAERVRELIAALGLTDARDKLVIDYSAGMTKKVTLACALVHGPRLLVLDEPFEAVDPVSARTIRGILEDFAAGGGTVVLSSHVMDLVERICTDVALITAGQVRVAGTVEQVRAGSSLEDRFLELVGGGTDVEGLAWLRTSSD